ncbi:MAG: phosphatidate cytidylyltransferase [Lachnospiraceae bacterium]|nr:phosphatidate cytidylyltransferase [Lachnospiraceae bacterium]MBR4144094.1 phosphatidate cytidylyltransferase [Lachnospiraceae bacterium]
MIRFRSSVILMAVAITAMVLGSYTLFGVIALITLIGLMELYRVVGVNKMSAGFVGYSIAVLYFIYVFIKEFIITDINIIDFTLNHSVLFKIYSMSFLIIIALLLIILLAVYVLTFPKYNSEQITMVFFGFFYVVMPLMYIFLTRQMEGGAYTVWLIFIGSWGSDTMAYVVGRKLGKTKIAPKLSPKKSLEGLIGGIVGAALIGIIYALIFKSKLDEYFSNPILVFALTGAIGSVVSQIGDMAASAIKRNKGIKDYGTLIPGHGGILDRFDSVIFIAPIVYLLMNIFSR